MNKPEHYYKEIPGMIPENVELFAAEIYKDKRSPTGFKAHATEKTNEDAVYGIPLMMDDAIYLRQDNDYDFTSYKYKPMKVTGFKCPIKDKYGTIIEYRYKIHEIIR